MLDKSTVGQLSSLSSRTKWLLISLSHWLAMTVRHLQGCFLLFSFISGTYSVADWVKTTAHITVWIDIYVGFLNANDITVVSLQILLCCEWSGMPAYSEHAIAYASAYLPIMSISHIFPHISCSRASKEYWLINFNYFIFFGRRRYHHGGEQ